MKPLRSISEGIFDDTVDRMISITKDLLVSSHDWIGEDELKNFIKSTNPITLQNILYASPVINANCVTIKEFRYEPETYDSGLTYLVQNPRISVKCESAVRSLRICSDTRFIKSGIATTGCKTISIANLDETVSDNVSFGGITGFKNCTIRKSNKTDHLAIYVNALDDWGDFDGLNITGFKPRVPDISGENDRLTIYLYDQCNLFKRVTRGLDKLKRYQKKYGAGSQEYCEVEDEFLKPIVERFPNISALGVKSKIIKIKKAVFGGYVVSF